MELTEQELNPIKQKLSKLKTKNNQVAQSLVNLISENLQQSITKGDIVIPKDKVQGLFLFQVLVCGNRKSDKSQANDSLGKLQQISEKKDQIQRQLQCLKKQQQSIKSGCKPPQKSSPHHNYYRSQLTQEDIQKLRKIKASQKQFERMQAQKTEQYEQRIKKMKQEQQQQKQRQKRQKYEIKKQEIQKTLQLIDKRKQERLSRLDQERKLLKEVKNRKKLHQSWEEKWKEIQEQEEKKKEQLKEELRKINKISYQDIKEHQKRYQQTIKTQKQSRMKQMATSRMDSPSCPYKSTFLESIIEQENKKKDEVEARRSLPKQFLNKIKQYSDKVKQFHKPTVQNKGQQQVKQQKIGQVRSMSLFETHQKGNQYMKKANQQVLQAFKSKNLNSQPPKPQKPQPRYKNYLKELHPSEPDRQRKTSDLSTLRQLLKKQNLSAQQKFYQAKLLTQKLQKRKVIHTSQGIVNSINAKIEILRQVEL